MVRLQDIGAAMGIVRIVGQAPRATEMLFERS